MVILPTDRSVNDTLFMLIENFMENKLHFCIDYTKDVVSVYCDDFKFQLHWFDNNCEIGIEPIDVEKELTINDIPKLHLILKNI